MRLQFSSCLPFWWFACRLTCNVIGSDYVSSGNCVHNRSVVYKSRNYFELDSGYSCRSACTSIFKLHLQATCKKILQADTCVRFAVMSEVPFPIQPSRKPSTSKRLIARRPAGVPPKQAQRLPVMLRKLRSMRTSGHQTNDTDSMTA